MCDYYGHWLKLDNLLSERGSKYKIFNTFQNDWFYILYKNYEKIVLIKIFRLDRKALKCNTILHIYTHSVFF